jgi:magnesium-transporting ATPase (P-type)
MQNQSEFERKYKKAIEELNNSTIWRTNRLPLAHRLTAKLGIQSRPPYYQSFVFNLIVFASFMALLMVVSGWIVGLESPTITILNFAAGIVMGLWMALYIRFTAQKQGLSKWRDL